MENLIKEQRKNKFCKRYIENSFELYNANTEELINNKYIQLYGNLDNEYISMILRKLFAHFQKQGHKINTPQEFLELCNI